MPRATSDGQDRFVAADLHPDAAFRIGRQIAVAIVFSVAGLFTPGFRFGPDICVHSPVPRLTSDLKNQRNSRTHTTTVLKGSDSNPTNIKAAVDPNPNSRDRNALWLAEDFLCARRTNWQSRSGPALSPIRKSGPLCANFRLKISLERLPLI